MSAFEDILSRVDAGEQGLKIALYYPWISLSLEDRERLFAEAEKRGYEGEPLIQVLYYLVIINQAENKWDGIRVASLSFRFSPSDENRKRQILGWIDKSLEELRQRWLKDKPDEILRYRRYVAETSVLKAIYYLEVDKIDEALKNYREALAQFKECGSKEQIIKLSEIIQHWQTIQKNQNQMLPIEQFESERLRLNKEIADLEIRKKQLQIEEERINKNFVELQKSASDLTIRNIQLREEENKYIAKQSQLIVDIAEKEK